MLKWIVSAQAFFKCFKQPHKVVSLLEHFYYKTSKEGEIAPTRFYGVGHIDPLRAIVHWYIIPLNYVIQLQQHILHLWDKVRFGISRFDKQVIEVSAIKWSEGYGAGFEAGKKQGFKEGEETTLNSLQSQLKEIREAVQIIDAEKDAWAIQKAKELVALHEQKGEAS